MYKFLTDEQKKVIKREYVLRRAVIILWAIIAVTVVGIVGVFPSFILSNAHQAEVEERLRILGSSGLSEEDKELKAWLADFNKKMKMMAPQSDTDRPSLTIEDVLESRVTGAAITNFVWKRERGKIVLTVSGVANDRQSLINFENELDVSGHFGDVALPISNLARDKDISFQVKLLPVEKP